MTLKALKDRVGALVLTFSTAAMLSPLAVLASEGKEGEMPVVEEFTQKVVIHLPKVFGIDFSITQAVIYLWISSAMIITLFALVRIGLSEREPKGLQNVMEWAVDFVQGGIVGEAFTPEHAPRWFAFIATIFFYVLFNNLIGLLPPKPYTANSNVSITIGLAVVVFFVTHYAGIREQGPIKYFANFVPGGLPKAMVPFMWVIHLVSEMTRPLSLAFRLYGNMIGGHVVLLILGGMAVIVFKSFYVGPLLFAMSTVLLLFEIFVAFIQAYIFAFLSALYIAGAVHPDH